VDNAVVQRILHAAEDVAYTSSGGGAGGGARRYSTDPLEDDDTTTASGSDAPPRGYQPRGRPGYLAEQETAFSDGVDGGDSAAEYFTPATRAPAKITKNTSTTSSSGSSVVLTLVPAEVRLEVGDRATQPPERAQFPAESPDSPGGGGAGGESRVVYQESEADNSCVDMDEDDEETGERGARERSRGSGGSRGSGDRRPVQV
jgi:hypothetical protein